MLTLNQLRQLLLLNEQLIKSERRSSRVSELLTHRAIVKDMIIEELDKQLTKLEFNAMLKTNGYKQVQ